MSSSNEKKPEEQLQLLSQKLDKYIETLNTAENIHRKTEPYNEGLIALNMVKVGIRSFKNFKVIFPIIGSGLAFLYGKSMWGSLTSLQKTYTIAIAAASAYFTLRTTTLKAMATPADNLFHIQAYAKVHKDLYEALSPFITDDYFSFSKLKDGVKKQTIDEKIIDGYKNREEELKEQISEMKSEIQQFTTYSETLVDELKSTKEERTYYASRLQEESEFLATIRDNLTLFINKPNMSFLDSLHFNYRYVIYKLGDNKFEHKHSKGVNAAVIQTINSADSSNIVVKAYKSSSTNYQVIDWDTKEASACFPLSDTSVWAVRIIFDEYQLTTLKKDEEDAKIRLSTTFEHFWISLELVTKIESFTEKLVLLEDTNRSLQEQLTNGKGVDA